MDGFSVLHTERLGTIRISCWYLKCLSLAPIRTNWTRMVNERLLIETKSTRRSFTEDALPVNQIGNNSLGSLMIHHNSVHKESILVERETKNLKIHVSSVCFGQSVGLLMRRDCGPKQKFGNSQILESDNDLTKTILTSSPQRWWIVRTCRNFILI